MLSNILKSSRQTILYLYKQPALSPLKTTSLFILIAGAILWCCTKKAITTNTQHLPFLNLHDSVQYVGMQTCVSCHKDVHDDYQHTGMGQSFNLATKQKSAGVFDQHALVYDSIQDFYYQPFWKGDTMKLKEFRMEGKDTLYQRIETIHYIVGSGQHTNSHMTQVNGYLYQAPITYYTQQGKWDLPPGYENGNNSRFDRTIGIECMTCHNHLPQFDEASENRFTKIPTGIECERCHGPGELHVNKMIRGEFVDTALQADYTIVKPSRLNIDQQMSLCQRCHLQGITVLKENKSFYDFRPGMELNDIMNVFVARYSTDDEFIMASQADRLRMSLCFVESENMSCITCHNPHKSVQTTTKEFFNSKCTSCHQSEGKNCTESLDARNINGNNCSSCHMPKSGSVDIPHVSITDHQIQIPRIQDDEKNAIKKFVELECRTDDNPSDLEMTQGYLAYYEKFGGGEEALNKAFQILSKQKKAEFIADFGSLDSLLVLKK